VIDVDKAVYGDVELDGLRRGRLFSQGLDLGF
jgi:hypothetical protein